MKKHFPEAIIGIAVSGCLVTWFCCRVLHGPCGSPKALAKSEGTSIIRAIEVFRNEYQTFPTGSQAQVIAALSNNNPRRTHFLEIRSDAMNKRGEFCDPWQTPYRITTTGTNLEVRSAGPDRKFGTPDDLVVP